MKFYRNGKDHAIFRQPPYTPSSHPCKKRKDNDFADYERIITQFTFLGWICPWQGRMCVHLQIPQALDDPHSRLNCIRFRLGK